MRTLRLAGLLLVLGVSLLVAATFGDSLGDSLRDSLGSSAPLDLYIAGALYIGGALFVVAGAALLIGFLVGRRRRQVAPVVAVTVGVDPVSGWWAAAIPTGARRLLLLGATNDPDTKIFKHLANACAATARSRRSLPRATLRDWQPLASGLVAGSADAYKLATDAIAQHRAVEPTDTGRNRHPADEPADLREGDHPRRRGTD